MVNYPCEWIIREDNTPSFKPFVFHHISGLFQIVKYHFWALHKHSLKEERHCLFAVDFTCVHNIKWCIQALHNARDETTRPKFGSVEDNDPSNGYYHQSAMDGQWQTWTSFYKFWCPKGRHQHVSQMRENCQVNFFSENVGLACSEACPCMGDEKCVISNKIHGCAM